MFNSVRGRRMCYGQSRKLGRFRALLELSDATGLTVVRLIAYRPGTDLLCPDLVSANLAFLSQLLQ